MDVDTSKCWCCKNPLKPAQRGRDYYCKACGVYLPWSWYREAITTTKYDRKIEWERCVQNARPDYTLPLIAYQVTRNQIDMQAAQSRLDYIKQQALQADVSAAELIRKQQTLDALQSAALISAEERSELMLRSYIYCGSIDHSTDFR